MLKFWVFDENVHKAPGASSADSFLTRIATIPSGARPRPPNQSDQRAPDSDIGGASFYSQFGNVTSSNVSIQTSSPPMSLYHIPPPPVIFSSFSPSYGTTDVDPMPCSPTVTNTTIGPDRCEPRSNTSPQHQDPQPRAATPKQPSCCGPSQAKLEIQTLMASFKNDLDNIITKSFGSLSSTACSSDPSLNMSTAKASPESDAPSCSVPHPYCSTCLKTLRISWLTSTQCRGWVMVRFLPEFLQ